MTAKVPGGGSSLLSQLQKVEKESGKTPAKLKAYRDKETPIQFQYLSDLFEDFYTGGNFTYTELKNYQETMGVNLEPYECEILRQLWLEKRVSEMEQDAKLRETQMPRKGKRKRGR